MSPETSKESSTGHKCRVLDTIVFLANLLAIILSSRSEPLWLVLGTNFAAKGRSDFARKRSCLS